MTRFIGTRDRCGMDEPSDLVISRTHIICTHMYIRHTFIVFFLSEIRVIRCSCARPTKVVVLDVFVTDIRKASLDR